jgi:hypothetical protein
MTMNKFFFALDGSACKKSHHGLIQPCRTPLPYTIPPLSAIISLRTRGVEKNQSTSIVSLSPHSNVPSYVTPLTKQMQVSLTIGNGFDHMTMSPLPLPALIKRAHYISDLTW